MGHLSTKTFSKWLEKNDSKLSEIYTIERNDFARAKFDMKFTTLNAAIVYMVDPSSDEILLETFLVAISDGEIDKINNTVAVEHIKMVDKSKGNAPVSELLIQVDGSLNTLDYSLKTITNDEN